MNMSLTFTLWELGYFMIGILIIILLLYAIIFIKNLIPLLKTSLKILQDVNTVSEVAAEKTKEIDGVVTNITEAVGLVADSIKGNQNKATAITNLINALTSLKNLLKK